MSISKPYRNRGILFVLPAFLVLMFSFVLPILAVVNFSLQDVFSGNNFFWAGERWFAQILNSMAFWQTLGRTFLFSLLAIAIEVPLGLWIALHMPRSGPAATFFIVIAAVPLLIPWFVVGMVWKIMTDPTIGPVGALAARVTAFYDLNEPVVAWAAILVTDVWHWTGLVVLLAYAGFVAIPQAQYQAAAVDGASRRAVFRYVELPRLRHVLLIALLLRLTDSLMVYIEPFMITRGGPGTATTFLSQDLIQTAMIQFDFGEASAAALVYLLIMLTLSWTLYRIMMARDA